MIKKVGKYKVALEIGKHILALVPLYGPNHNGGQGKICRMVAGTGFEPVTFGL